MSNEWRQLRNVLIISVSHIDLLLLEVLGILDLRPSFAPAASVTAVDLLFFDLVVLLLAPPEVVDVGISLDGPGKGLSSSIESAVIKQFDFIKGQLVNFYFAKTDTVTDQNRVLVWYSTCSAGLAAQVS